MKKLMLFQFLVMLCFVACKKEQEVKPIEEKTIRQYDVLVLNEGNFQWGQGTVSLYDSKNQKVISKVFQANNNQRPLGDVAQSVTFKGDTAYIIINNSEKIEVIDLNTFKSIGQITNLNSPREMLIIDQNKAYVSDLYEDYIYIVNPSTFEHIGKIPSHGWTEGMLLKDGKAFVCQVDSNQLYVIDNRTDQLLAKISTAASPQSIALDKNGAIWLSCTGRADDTAAIQKINTAQLEVETTILGKSGETIFLDIALNSAKDELCILSDEGLYQVAISAGQLPNQPLIKAKGRNFYSMNVNSASNEIYICDAMDYQQKGMTYRYDWSGKEIDHFRAGIIPGAIYFP